MRVLYKKMCFQAFLIGYKQHIPGRSFRRVIATTELHRAWLAGNIGKMGEIGVLDRQWYTNRKQTKAIPLTRRMFIKY